MKFLPLHVDSDIVPEYLTGLEGQHARNCAHQTGLAAAVLPFEQKQFSAIQRELQPLKQASFTADQREVFG